MENASCSTESFNSDERLLSGSIEKQNSDDCDSFLHKPRPRQRRRYQLSLPWTVASCSFLLNLALIFLSLNLSLQPGASRFGSLESGYSTDLAPAKAAMQVHRMPFTGELKFDENDTMYRDMPGLQYFGEPSPEIDKNWHDLMYAAGLDLPESEITEAGLKDTTWEEPQGGLWRSGLDVFHQLHCVNMVRKSFYPDYYTEMHDDNIDDPPRLRNMHRDHCLDYIRQSLQCTADATPVRLKWHYKHHILIAKFEQEHTCRNFERLHSWSKEQALELHHKEAKALIEGSKGEGVL